MTTKKQTFDFSNNHAADPIELWVLRVINRKDVTTTEAAVALLLAYRINSCCQNPFPMHSGELARLGRQIGLNIHGRADHWARLRGAITRLQDKGFLVLHLRADPMGGAPFLTSIEVIVSGGR